MFSRSWGGGEEIVIGLHGWGGDHQAFAPLVPWLSGDFKLVSCDLPGYGKTPAPSRFGREEVAASIAAWIDSLGHSRVTLLGNCSGALAALLAAPKLQTPLTRLILLDAFAYVPWYFRVFSNPAFGDYAYHATFANPVGRWLTNRGLAARRQAGTDMTSSFSRVNHAATLAWLRMMAEIPGYEYFRPVKAPIELVHGERTFDAVKRSINLWKKLWPHAPVTELRGAGHLGIAEAPRELAGIVFKTNVARAQEQHALAIS